jgi:hypothetical protein
MSVLISSTWRKPSLKAQSQATHSIHVSDTLKGYIIMAATHQVGAETDFVLPRRNAILPMMPNRAG